MTPPSADTSLATIRSQPFRAIFVRACSTTASVSAANPTTRGGRPDGRRATVARMSGFSTSGIGAGPVPSFLIFLLPASCSGRQSATAAAKTAMSAGSAASTAASICRAVSTRTTATPGGSGIATGPETRVTAAPAAAAAAAMA